MKLFYMDAIHDVGSGSPPELFHIHPVTVKYSGGIIRRNVIQTQRKYSETCRSVSSGHPESTERQK